MHGVAGSDRILEHIAALLVALAVQAERAACRSFPIRWLALVILRTAEARACACAAEVTPCEWRGFAHTAELGYGPGDAILLAARFRMLAAMLAALLRAGRVPPGRSRRCDGARACFVQCAARPAVVSTALAGGPYDTS